MALEVETLLDYRRKLLNQDLWPIQLEETGDSGRLASSFYSQGNQVQRVGRHSQGYTSKGRGWAGLLTPHAARGPRETGGKLSLPGGMVGRGVSHPGRQRPGSVLVHWAKRPPRCPLSSKGLSVRIRESKPETSVFLVLGEAI